MKDFLDVHFAIKAALTKEGIDPKLHPELLRTLENIALEWADESITQFRDSRKL